MSYSWINQRLKDLENNIELHLKLLKDFEKELSVEKHPVTRTNYEMGIEREKESIAKYQKEYNELKKLLNDSQ